MTSYPETPSQENLSTGSTLLRLEGEDALGLLHRLSTQTLSDLEPGRLRMTLFCDFRGRLLHRAAVAVAADRSVWVVRDDAPGDELIDFIDRHLFRERVRIFDAGTDHTVRAVHDGFGLGTGTLEERDGVPSRLQFSEAFGVRVESGGAGGMDLEGERRRILAGRPRHGREVRDAFNPFEVGLAHEVHLDKGCFTGQEALMRMVTYGGVRRRLARVSGLGALPGATEINQAGKRVGVLTSAVEDDRGWVGLAVIQRSALTEPATLELGGDTLEPPVVLPETRPAGLP